MPLRVLEILRKSKLVKEIVFTNFDGVGDYYRLKVRVRLKNDWLMDVWEHKTPELRRYSYHVYSNKGMIVRWDNAPHFKDMPTFPHHKHIDEKIIESKEMTTELVLSELRKLMKRRY